MRAALESQLRSRQMIEGGVSFVKLQWRGSGTTIFLSIKSLLTSLCSAASNLYSTPNQPNVNSHRVQSSQRRTTQSKELFKEFSIFRLFSPYGILRSCGNVISANLDCRDLNRDPIDTGDRYFFYPEMLIIIGIESNNPNRLTKTLLEFVTLFSQCLFSP